MVAIPRFQRSLFVHVLTNACLLGSSAVFAAQLTFQNLDGSDGLCSPRKLTVYNGDIYVAEAGQGPIVDPPFPNETDSCPLVRGEYTCIDSTGQVSMIPLAGGALTTVLSGLFSTRPLGIPGETVEESHVTGPHSVGFDSSGTLFTVVGLGLNGTRILELGFDEVYGNFGSVLRGMDAEVVAEPWVSEYEFNYDGSSVPDSNPYHILISGTKYYVVSVFRLALQCQMTRCLIIAHASFHLFRSMLDAIV